MSERHPVIVLMADTVIRQALSCYGGAIHTPHLDALAQHSYRFERLYQPANMCQPSRITWMTGCLPSRHQVYSNGFNNNPRRQRTLLRDLADAGYRGGYLGLFHCWPGPDRDGLEAWRWIDWLYDWHTEQEDWRVTPAVETAWKRELEALGISAPEYHLRDFHHHAGHTEFPLGRHPAVRITDRALACLADFTADRPHFLWTSYWMPHEPWAPPREHLERFADADLPLPTSWQEGLSGAAPRQGTAGNRAAFLDLGPDIESNLRRLWRAYAGCMSLVDEQIGRILTELRRSGLYDKSVIVFCTDHGTTHGAHGWLYKGGSFAIDEVSRVPCLLKLPGQRDGQVVPDVVSSADLYPTLLELLGLPRDPARTIDGRSWSDLLSGRPRTQARAFCQHLDGAQVGGDAVRSLVKDGRKFTLFSVPGQEQLFDLLNDPGELHNLADEQPQLRAELRGELVEMIRSGDDAFRLP